MDQVFSGLRVLDFGRFIAGPWCGAILADLGADVIRIEKREGGEDRWVQAVGPNGAGAGYLINNRNKRGLTLDTTTAEGQAIARKLIATADIVIANMPDKAMKANGLDFESLRAVKPDIILASATAFGRGGPYSNRVGFDGVGQCMSGAVHRTGPEETPYKAAVPWVDYATALSLTIATLAAVIHRNATGEGQHVEAALLPSSLMVANALCVEETVLGRSPPRVGNRGMAIGPADLFAVEDGWILVQVSGQPMFRRWCELVGRPEWHADARFSDDEMRARNIEPLNERMREWCRGLSVEGAIAGLDAARIPASPVLSPAQAVTDNHIEEMGFFHSLDYPGLERPAPVIETPFRMSVTPPSVRTRAPTLGEHTSSILAELGYGEDDVERLQAAGVV